MGSALRFLLTQMRCEHVHAFSPLSAHIETILPRPVLIFPCGAWYSTFTLCSLPQTRPRDMTPRSRHIPRMFASYFQHATAFPALALCHESLRRLVAPTSCHQRRQALCRGPTRPQGIFTSKSTLPLLRGAVVGGRYYLSTRLGISRESKTPLAPPQSFQQIPGRLHLYFRSWPFALSPLFSSSSTRPPVHKAVDTMRGISQRRFETSGCCRCSALQAHLSEPPPYLSSVHLLRLI
ncbi:uncharacterized protein BDZ83DRAFT_138543 [Colletotrichum acutatum]|uniref:Uncharacterized protein n=1 Tax=Glomerella acutata TaxID=27357 RepID=A0AAD8UT02_GLOAC|nr:uncharacterized protein BDZ83DRAFT_138543 [Colletotrichum acutatum]KAK1728272.1 hypothetical protein BDZ83DRAFT_138543 [Colletotrichum acutatum]